MVELEEQAPELRRRGLGIAAISYDSPAILQTFSERRKISYPLLADEGSKMIRAFGLLNEAVPAGHPFFGIPHPVTLIVDASGKVVSKYFEEDYRRRYTVSDILVKQYGAGAEAAMGEVESRQLTARFASSSRIARPGQRIALTVDVELKPAMHVYAPGVEGYRPVEWTMEDSPAWDAAAVEFPKSEKLFLKAIDETVPVFRGKFRLVREVTISQPAKLKGIVAGGSLLLKGTFKYQACDDRLCYVPASVPLEWTLRFENLDTERVPEALRRVK